MIKIFLLLVLTQMTVCIYECNPGRCILCTKLVTQHEFCKNCINSVLVEGECEAGPINNCKIFKGDDPLSYSCEECKIGFALSYNKKECLTIPEKIGEFKFKDCKRGIYKNKKRFVCDACKNGYPQYGSGICLNDLKLPKNCELGGYKAECVKCKKNYSLGITGGVSFCSKELKEGCGKYSFFKDSEGCEECNHLNGYYATKGSLVPGEEGKYYQTCEYYSGRLKIIFLITALLIFFM